MDNDPSKKYESSIIYLIKCKNSKIPAIYVGSTTDKKIREDHHRVTTVNQNGAKYNLKLYQTIRKNGGWLNWEMVEIEKYPCKNKLELRLKEQDYIDQLKPDLNQIAASVRCTREEYPKIYYRKVKDEKLAHFLCDCGIFTSRSHVRRHQKTKRHKTRINDMGLLSSINVTEGL